MANNKIDFVINTNDGLKTYTYLNDKNDIKIEWFIVINNAETPSAMLNFRGLNNNYNPMFNFINQLVADNILKSINQIEKIIIPNEEETIDILRENIVDIQNVSIIDDARTTINLNNISNYVGILSKNSYNIYKEEE